MEKQTLTHSLSCCVGATETSCQRGKVDFNSFHQWYYGSIQIRDRVEGEVTVKSIVNDQGSACRLLVSMWVCMPSRVGNMASLLGLCQLYRCLTEKQFVVARESEKSSFLT